MKKIGIITINDYNNYGNRLQNFAMQEIFKNKGFLVETIRNTPQAKNTNNIVAKLKMLNRYIRKMPYNIKYRDRYNNFMSFNKKINETNFTINSNYNINKNFKDFTGLVIGSDQIWNPYFRGNYFLDFAEGINLPTISVAASFGVSTIPQKSLDFYSQNLLNVNSISVRENEGKDLVYELTKRKAKVVLDPTMILTSKEWLTVAKPHKNKPDEKYILIYTLGGLSSIANALVNDLVKKKNYKLVTLGDKEIAEYYDAGPSEFLDYIRNAELMITDSFHGIVFSLLFKTPFIIFEREDIKGDMEMNSRIETFCNHFNVHERKLRNVQFNNIYNMDFESLDKILEKKRNEFNEFVDSSLKHLEIE